MRRGGTWSWVRAAGFAALLGVIGTTTSERVVAAGRAEILWDRYGVPHVFAPDREAMFYANGWAQMHAQANLLLRLYGESRGRAAEYWGGTYAALDRWVQLNEVPERARQWYDAQEPTFRRYLDAFAVGINDYATDHPSAGGAFRRVLPITGVDVIGHSLRAVHYGYMGSPERMEREVRAAQRGSGGRTARVEALEEQELKAGSNTWTIGPTRSASGHAMLLINPHLAWGDTFYRYMEMHLVAPGYDLYGAPQIGFPTPVVGFNRKAGWGRTVNTIDTVDFFTLTTKDNRYLYDGQWRPLERATKTLKVRQPDGSLKEETVEIRRSVHGPIVHDRDGLTVAMRVAGLDRPRMLEQWFRMGEAETLDQFKEALRLMSIPMWHANYADAEGHLMFVFDGLVPKRSGRDYDYWNRLVPGDTSATMWTDYLTFDELPKSIDPPNGFTQNANEPPWLATVPPIDRTAYPPYVAPTGQALPQMRTLRSLRMITEEPKVSFDQLIAKKHSTRMELADKVLPDLLKAASGKTEAARVLERWDRLTDAESRGGVLFELWVQEYLTGPGGIAAKLRVPYDPARPLESAYGLNDPDGAVAALARAAEECLKRYGALDVRWGDVYRFAAGDVDVPGNGGAGASGLFRTVAFTRREGNRFYAAHGETIVCAIEFGPTQQARCTLGYGNSSQPDSPHLGDQLSLMASKQLHPVWRERGQIERNLEWSLVVGR